MHGVEYATIVDPETGFGGMYSIGDVVEGAWTLVEVGPTVALLRDDASGAEHVVELAVPSAGAGAPRTAAGKRRDDSPPTGPQSVSRADLTRAASDPQSIGARARIGKDGVTLSYVKKGSPAYNLGFRRGDVLLSVAGVKLSSPDAALDAMQKVKTAPSADVVVLRSRAEVTLHFNLTE